MIRVGQVRIVAIDGTLPVVALMNDSAPQLSGGAGGWNEVQRPRRTSLMEWEGQSGYTLGLDLLFDGYAEHRNVQGEVDRLAALARVRPGASQPPVVRVEGAIPKPHLEWVIGDLAWGDMLRDETTGILLRQYVSVTLNEHVAAVVLIRKHNPADTGPRNYRHYRIRKHDTLHKVAVKFSPKHSPSKAVHALALHIKKINHIRDPKRFFKRHVGKVILIP